jgi:hypothetical protein
MTVLVGGLRAMNANFNEQTTGVLTQTPGSLNNNFFVNLIDMNTSWKAIDEQKELFQGTDTKTGKVKWTASRVDLIFGSNSELRALAEVYAANDSKEKFVKDLQACDHLHYLHFIGGETLITPGFEKILTALIDCGVADQITIGFTTNLTVWKDNIVDLLTQFQNVNLGMSIETMTTLNDYVRWPSQINRVTDLLDRWVDTGHKHNWLIQLRITPTCLTLHELHTVYDYAWQQKIAVESCNFIDRPEFMRIGVLPPEQRAQARQNLSNWIDLHQTANTDTVVNTRDPNRAHDQILQDAQSYLNYLDQSTDESDRLPDLVDYLKRLESGRGNSIVTYLPEYETLFRSAGY